MAVMYVWKWATPLFPSENNSFVILIFLNTAWSEEEYYFDEIIKFPFLFISYCRNAKSYDVKKDLDIVVFLNDKYWEKILNKVFW